MKNICKLLIVALLPALLLLPRVDAVFSATMLRKALAESVLLLLGGCAVSRLCPWRRWTAHAPPAVVAATLLLLFWMIPRSIDFTQSYSSANALFVISLFGAGLLLSHYLPLLPSVARVAYALYFSSMIVALGLLYACQSTLLCSAYTLEDQQAFGWMLVPVGLVAYLFVLVSMPRWLVPSANGR